jgi:hypothetical protein
VAETSKTKKHKAVTSVEEMDGQDSPCLAAMKYYGVPLTRDEFIGLSYLGEVDPHGEIPADVEETFPEQFRRKTLVETPPVSEKLQ